MGGSGFCQTAFAEDGILFAAVRAFKITEVFHDGKNGHIHHLCHVAGFFHDHAHQFLGRGYYDDAVYRHGLENGQRHVAGSGRHIHQKEIHVAVDHIGPELLDGSGDDGTPPYHRIRFILQQQVDRHDLDSHTAFHGEYAPVSHEGVTVEPEGFRDRGTGHVGVQDGHLFTGPAEGHGQKGGDHGFSHASLAADDADYFFNVTFLVGRLLEGGRILPLAAAGGAAAAVMIAICHLYIHLLFILV